MIRGKLGGLIGQLADQTAFCWVICRMPCKLFYSGFNRNTLVKELSGSDVRRRWQRNGTICTQYNEKIMGGRSYSEQWILGFLGANSLYTGNIHDHTHSEYACTVHQQLFWERVVVVQYKVGHSQP